MTAPVAADGRWATPELRRAAARDAYRQAAASGRAPTGAELGRRFGRSERWGRDRIAECRTDTDTTTAAAARRPAVGDPATAAAARTPAVGDAGPAAAGSGGPAGDGSRSHAAGTSSRHEGGRTAAAGPAPADGRSRAERRAQRIDTTIVAVVAVVAAAASYEHQRELAALAGEGDLAYVLPLSVDGMMLATSRSILRRRRAGLRVPGLSWFGFLLGFVGSVAANVAAAEPTVAGRLVAAWPPVALFIAHETLAADHGDPRGGR